MSCDRRRVIPVVVIHLKRVYDKTCNLEATRQDSGDGALLWGHPWWRPSVGVWKTASHNLSEPYKRATGIHFAVQLLPIGIAVEILQRLRYIHAYSSLRGKHKVLSVCLWSAHLGSSNWANKSWPPSAFGRQAMSHWAVFASRSLGGGAYRRSVRLPRLLFEGHRCAKPLTPTWRRSHPLQPRGKTLPRHAVAFSTSPKDSLYGWCH